LRRFLWPAVVVVFAIGAYAGVQYDRGEFVDFAVPYRAATRFVAHEPLYQPGDGHYQFKYFPAFAAVMVPFTIFPKAFAEVVWFALMFVMTWAFMRMAVHALPARRMAIAPLVWLTLLLNGENLVKELAFGQFNLPLGLLLLGAIVAAQRGRGLLAGALVAAGVFVKPYALVLVPWLVLTQGWRPLAVFTAVLAAGLTLPVVSYGWDGNLTLLQEWYRTVTDTTAPNLMSRETVSFASMWAKWIGPGPAASQLATVTSIVAVACGLLPIAKRKRVAEPNYLEGAYFFTLIPLLSPQGWDYVMILALPAYVLLVDRWRDMSLTWRAVTLLGFILTSFGIYDVMRRTVYLFVMGVGGGTIGAVLMAASLVRLRWRAQA
jgi:hypothetical protein